MEGEDPLLMTQLGLHQQLANATAGGISQLLQSNGTQSSSIVVLPPADAIDESHLWSVHSTSEMVEMLYQMCFFAIGAPLNAVALRNFYKKSVHFTVNCDFGSFRYEILFWNILMQKLNK